MGADINASNALYDIGHLFGATGGGGNAGCIGCVCVNPTGSDQKQKGSAYTSPADAIPQGDNFVGLATLAFPEVVELSFCSQQ